MITETVAGRKREETERIGLEGSGYIGKHIVGTGEDTHLTTKVYMDLIRPHVILIAGKRGTGKCVTGDTLVYLSDGRLLPIERLVKQKVQEKNLAFNFSAHRLEESRLINFFEREVSRILEVELWNGLKVRTSMEHPFLTISGWKKGRDLKKGEWVAVAKEVRIKGRKKMRECEVKLIAYILAEGTLGNTFVWFTNKNKTIREDFKKSVEEFDPNLELKEYGRFTLRVVGKGGRIINKTLKRRPDGTFGKGTKLLTERNSLLKWLSRLGLRNKKSGEKFIPQPIFLLPLTQLSLFLRCLFSCDGTIYIKRSSKRLQPVIEYTSKSRKLIEGIYYLLLRFGILSYIREKTVKDRKYYTLYITHLPDIKKFLRKIGFLRRRNLQNKVLKFKTNYHSNFYLVPKDVWIYIREKYKNKEIGKALGYKNYKGVPTKYKYNPLKLTVKRLAKRLNDNYLKFVSSDDIAWIKIKNIKVVNRRTKVYDVEVNDKHNFIGNGIILHNSYSAGVLIEEILSLEEKYKKKMAVVIFDPIGIYWSMKFPNEQQKDLLKKWKLHPKGFNEIKVYVPLELKEIYMKAGIPVDYTLSISPKDFSPDDWALAFNWERTSPLAIHLERVFNKLTEEKGTFSVSELIESVKKDTECSQEIKNTIVSFLEVAKGWGIFSEKGMKIDEIVKPGLVSIIDLSRVKGEEWGLRNLVAAWITRNVYKERVIARKEEELAKLEKREPKKVFPLTWLIFEEAHNFCPSDKKTVSTEPILMIAKQGREPGVSLVVITQMPNKVHSDILCQCDLVFAHRLTSKADLDALHAIMQTYMRESIEKHMNLLPKWPGVALILDDSLERIFTINFRPRLSWHAGGTAVVR